MKFFRSFSSPSRAVSLATLAVGLLASSSLAAQDFADTIYSGGSILTIDDAAPRAEAVAVKDGRILAVGSLDQVLATKGDATKMIDLTGKTMLPGFVDSHGHVVMGGIQALSANLLPAPDGDVNDIAALQATLSGWKDANKETVDKVNMIIGFGYDNAQLKELRHPTRHDLDAVSTDIPIIIIHQSGHIGVANTKALELAKVTADTKIDGGVFQKDPDGSPSGVMEEYAFFSVLIPMLSELGAEGTLAFAEAGTKLWASFGYTTAQEGRSSAGVVAALHTLADAGKLDIDVVAYPDYFEARDFIKENVSKTYDNRVRVGGVKLTIDGSPQGFTALRDRPYYAPVGNYPAGYHGYSAITMDQTVEAINWAYENDIQILTHSNGEGASDMLLAAIGQAQSVHGKKPTRPVLIHGQFLREDQVDTIQRLGVFPSLFPMHTFYWGDWHRDHTVGPVNADNISPTGWVHSRGMMFGSHHDAPVAFPDSMRILSATVTRRTRSGDILGPAQRVDVMTALKAITIWPAWQHFEEDQKGSIETGKLADFVILSKDPTAINPEDLDTIRVLASIKDDKMIYEAPTGQKRADLQPLPFVANPDAAHEMLHVLHHAIGGKPRADIHRH